MKKENFLKLPTRRPLVTVDVAIFTVIEDVLHVLLVRRAASPDEPYSGVFALPGGFVDVDTDDSLEACALRKLRDKTGIESPYLEQVGSWGSADRDPRGWSTTHVYFALLPHEIMALQKGGNAEEVSWHPIIKDGVKQKLAFDHAQLLSQAVRRLRSKAEYTSLPVYLLPDVFTLPELQRAYEIVLGRALEKSAFRTRMLAASFIEPTGEARSAANRPAVLYKLVEQAEVVVFPRTFKPK